MQGTAIVTQQPAVGIAQQPAIPAPSGAYLQQQQVPSANEPAPSLGNGQQGSGERTFRDFPTDNNQQQVTPGPGGETNGVDPYRVNKDENSTYFEAPKLFNPKDRTAQRSIAPVHTALYQQPVSYRQISSSRTPVTAAQAQQDAAGWNSASN